MTAPPDPPLSPLRRLAHGALRESGLGSVYSAGLDAGLIIACRTSRMFAYGASSLILALFFSELGVTDSRIGLFMTLTLAGDVALSLLLTLTADRVVGRRRTLLLGALMMMASGATFALSENFWVLLAAAVVGVISATGGDFGPFRAVEQSILSELTRPATRSDVLVWYVTMSSLGSCIGTELSGRIIEWLRARDGWTLLDAYHGCFWLYTAMGAVNVACNMLLSKRCELRSVQQLREQQQQQQQQQAAPQAHSSDETEPLLQGHQTTSHYGDDSQPADNTPKTANSPPSQSSWVPQISHDTLTIMTLLWLLLMTDSLADGMSSMSLTSYYLDSKFSLPKSSLGDILSIAYFLASCSAIFAGPLARYIGLVNTMVFTHIPSSAAVLLFPFAQSIPATIALLLVRVGLNNMDQAPRAALIAAVVRPEERTAAMGITGMLRTLASTTGPSITGVLADAGLFWVAFVVAGALRLAYDFGVFAMFVNIKLHRHEQTDEAEGGESGASERRASADGENV
jgi:MFS family permease